MCLCHPLTGVCALLLQYLRQRKVFFAHDEKEECVEGDVVMIKSCFPVSKKKHYVIDEILEPAPRYSPDAASQQDHSPDVGQETAPR